MAAIRYISHLHVPGAYKQHIAIRNMYAKFQTVRPETNKIICPLSLTKLSYPKQGYVRKKRSGQADKKKSHE